MIAAVRQILEIGYSDCKLPLREISESLLDNDELFFSYDEIVKKLYGENPPKSPDLLLVEKECLTFVEFKGGKIKNIKKEDVKLKGIEGCFLALERLLRNSQKLESFEQIWRLKKQYIVVYNEKELQNRKKNEIHAHMENKATNLLFGLQRYEGTFFSAVKTPSSKVFEQWLVERR